MVSKLMNIKLAGTLNTKLLLGFGSLLLITSVTLYISSKSLSELNDRFNLLIGVNVQAVKIAPRIHRNIAEIRVLEKSLLLADTDAQRERIIYEISNVREELSERVKLLNKLNLDPESIELLGSFKLAFSEYDQTLNRLIELVKSGNIQKAEALNEQETNTNAKLASDIAIRFTNTQDKKFEIAQGEANVIYSQQVSRSIGLTLFASLVALLIALAISRMVVGGMTKLVDAAERITAGDLETQLLMSGSDEIGQLAEAITRMQGALKTVRNQAIELDWLKTGVARINDVILGQEDKQALASSVINEIATYLKAHVGAIYVAENSENGLVFSLLGTYAYTQRKNVSSRFKLGESLVGQAALERKQILIQSAPEDYIRVVSGLGESIPTNICLTPILFESTIRGVLEIATLYRVTELELEYLKQVVIAVAIAFEIVESQAMQKLQQEELRASNEVLEEQTRALEVSQQELRAQQIQLESTNTELEAQMQRVKESEEELKAQQEQLEVTNLDLRDKNQLLERQKTDIEKARREMESQAEELSLASKYKSEFLANMSHELRTPLNSLLLLTRTLAENKAGNLNADQIETAGVIYDSGSDLLNLINEILDLSKIEAGRMDLRLQSVELKDLMRSISLQFEPMANSQGLALHIDCEQDLPDAIFTDPQRLGQVIKNLVGNAFKFTESGAVSIRFCHAPNEVNLSKSGLVLAETLAIQVKDTGIGIPKDKQKIIFEAFQQADSGDRRRYGGTGLGLSISRELVGLLGGELQLASEPGMGSTFSIYIPFRLKANEGVKLSSSNAKSVSFNNAETGKFDRALPLVKQPDNKTVASVVTDDRETITDKDKVVLVIEDDSRFAKILASSIHERGFKCLIALTGEEGIQLARQFRPDGIVLDIQLPNMDGWDVLTDIKQNVDTRHIPVHIVSAEDPSNEGMRVGAIGHSCKPIRKEDIDTVLKRLEQASAHFEKWVLVVEDDELMREETVRLIGNGNVKVTEVGNGLEAIKALHQRNYALVILDLGLPDMQGLELLSQAVKENITLPPVIVYTVRELTMDEEMALRQFADSIILKDVRSQERLIDEIALFLHRVVSELSEDKMRVIRHLHESDEHLKGRKILIVEDDMRTMFAMTKLLAGHGLNPIKAENGQKALDILKAQGDISLILMDMMMPVMDGYEAMEQIRKIPHFAHLPIIALTAKAMKEDRKKCLEAGATDYLSKPVDPDRLLSLIRVWLCR